MLISTDLDEQISRTADAANSGHAPDAARPSELSDLWQPDEQVTTHTQIDFEDLLCQLGSVSLEQLEQARAVHRTTPRKRLGEILLEMGAVSEQNLLRCVAQQYELEFVRVERETVDPDALARLDRAFIEAHRIIPLRVQAGRLVVATADPTDVFLLDEVKRKTGLELTVQVCTGEDIRGVLNTINEPDTDFHVSSNIAVTIQPGTTARWSLFALVPLFALRSLGTLFALKSLLALLSLRTNQAHRITDPLAFGINNLLGTYI